MAKILRAASGKSVDEAPQAALGKSAVQLEVEWKQFYEIRSRDTRTEPGLLLLDGKL